MPFKSKNQMKAAFAGGLGPEMKAKAPEFAASTPNPSKLPAHVPRKRPRRSGRDLSGGSDAGQGANPKTTPSLSGPASSRVSLRKPKPAF